MLSESKLVDAIEKYTKEQDDNKPSWMTESQCSSHDQTNIKFTSIATWTLIHPSTGRQYRLPISPWVFWESSPPVRWPWVELAIYGRLPWKHENAAQDISNTHLHDVLPLEARKTMTLML